jgi:hypothetical protein
MKLYRGKLMKELKKLYTEEQIDEFSWYTDEDTVGHYAFRFIDHQGELKFLRFHKVRGEVTLS